MGFTPCKAEQPLQGMELQEKKFSLKFSRKYRKKVSEKWNVRDNKANFVKLFCMKKYVYIIILFKLRENLALCILSNTLFSKYYYFFFLLFDFFRLQFTEVGNTWRCEPINGVWMGGAAYVSPHEYINTAYFCSYRVIWVVTRKRSTTSSTAFFY